MTLVSDDTSRPYAVPTPSGARRGLKGVSARDQSTAQVSPVKWVINERYGLSSGTGAKRILLSRSEPRRGDLGEV